MEYRVLICDDDRDIVRAIGLFLKGEGYTVFEAYNGQEALDILDKEEVHLLLLDIMMPVMDGVETLQEIRKKWNLPVILLTAKSEDSDKVLGLNLGADDYVTKPFQPMELIARVKSQLRRYLQLGGNVPAADSFTFGNITLDNQSKTVTLDGEPVRLTKTEYDILHFLMQHPGTVYSPQEIYEEVWKDSAVNGENTVAVHMRHLREKVEITPSEPRYLKMIWGRGYYLDPGRG
ncbi:MAG: response regulator transcription factor [Lachnospiraceae bacterium]|jgi:DNA-binding response OmpR family regulator|nr:response regulator transcription factor [Lachnospiraceae bacterium]